MRYMGYPESTSLTLYCSPKICKWMGAACFSKISFTESNLAGCLLIPALDTMETWLHVTWLMTKRKDWPQRPILGLFLFLVLPLYCYKPIFLHPRAHMHSHVIAWTSARQAPLSMDFSRQEYWSGLPFPSPRAFSNCGYQHNSGSQI